MNTIVNMETKEKELPDDYPVYPNYFYVADGKVIICDLMEGTIADLKRDLKSIGKSAEVITNCDIAKRRLQPS